MLATIVIGVLLAGADPAPRAEVGMQSIARVTKLKRQRKKAREARRPRLVGPRDPGPLLDFIPRVSPRFHAPVHLRPFSDLVERSMTECVEACLSVPPRHGKTTLVTHAIAWILIQNPRAKILYASYAQGFAAKQVRKARQIAARAGVRFGQTKRRDEWDTAEGGFVKAVGVGGQIAGEGFTHIFVDDPHKNRAEAESQQIRERVITGFRDDIYTRQDPAGTSVFVVHTRWHEHDLIGELTRPLEAEEAEEADAIQPFVLLNIPAIRPANDNDGPDAANDNGVALAPEMFPLSRLRKIRARVGEYAWASLYMGSPRPRGGTLFCDAVLLEELDHSPDGYRYAIGVDLTRTARTRSDHNAAVVMRQSISTGLVDVVEVVRKQGVLADRVRGEEVLDEGFARDLHGLQQRYPGARTVMYTGRSEDQLLTLLAGLKKFPCRVEGILAQVEKYERAQAYAVAWRGGRVRLPRHARWTNGFVTEHIAFTGLKGGRDDQVDAAAAAFDALQKSHGAITVTTLKDIDEREDAREGWGY